MTDTKRQIADGTFDADTFDKHVDEKGREGLKYKKGKAPTDRPRRTARPMAVGNQSKTPSKSTPTPAPKKEG